MGSPLGPVLAGLYMEFFETELVHTISGPRPSLWLRYIDDIILQWAHSMEEFEIFLKKLCDLEDLINLQAEWEVSIHIRPESAQMAYLDLLTYRSPGNF